MLGRWDPNTEAEEGSIFRNTDQYAKLHKPPSDAQLSRTIYRVVPVGCYPYNLTYPDIKLFEWNADQMGSKRAIWTYLAGTLI